MEEKERYKYYTETNQIYDSEEDELYAYNLNNNKIISILNQQDKRIKELKEELDDAKRDYIPKLEFGLQRANKMGRDAEKEIQQLKQQLHELPKKIVEEIKEWIKSQIIYCGGKSSDVDILIANASNQVLEDLQNILDTILKKYGDE